MNRSQLMGLNSVDIDIYDIHRYFRELTIGQQTPEFLRCHPCHYKLKLYLVHTVTTYVCSINLI